MTSPEGYDRVEVNESDGQVFYGYDDEEIGTTSWYDSDNNIDCITETPDDEW